MSRAFVNEERFEQANGKELVERPISEHPNYVTPTGALELQTLEESLIAELNHLKLTAENTFAKDKVAEIERDLRYVRARLDSAILVDPTRVMKPYYLAQLLKCKMMPVLSICFIS